MDIIILPQYFLREDFISVEKVSHVFDLNLIIQTGTETAVPACL